MVIPVYPVVLTDADWQKKKGLFAKMAGETGIGAAMNKAQAAYKSVKWEAFSVKQAYPTQEAIDAAEKAAREEATKSVAVLSKQISALRDLAYAAEKKFKGSKTIPSSATAAAVAVSSECGKFIPALKGLDQVLKEFAESRKKLQNTQSILNKALTEAIPKVRNGIKIVEGTKTSQSYSDSCWQAVRGLSAMTSRYAFLVPFQAEWKTLSSIQPQDLKTPELLLGHLKKLEVLLNKTAQAIPA